MTSKKHQYSPSSYRSYSTYNFVGKDPVIDRLRTAIAANGMSWNEVAEASGVSHQTLRAWFLGTTQRPKFATVNAVVRAIGLEFTLSAKQKLRVVK